MRVQIKFKFKMQMQKAENVVKGKLAESLEEQMLRGKRLPGLSFGGGTRRWKISPSWKTSFQRQRVWAKRWRHSRFCRMGCREKPVSVRSEIPAEPESLEKNCFWKKTRKKVFGKRRLFW